VKYSSTYDDAAKVYRVRISQTPVRGVPESEEEGSVPGPWVIPIEWALVRDGADMKAGVYIMREDGTTCVGCHVRFSLRFACFG
jgi:hypothetical protein